MVRKNVGFPFWWKIVFTAVFFLVTVQCSQHHLVGLELRLHSAPLICVFGFMQIPTCLGYYKLVFGRVIWKTGIKTPTVYHIPGHVPKAQWLLTQYSLTASY